MEILDSSFEDCVFIGCYFRKTLIRSTEFKGCRFIGCDFPKVRIHSGRFGYCQFHRCFIPMGELKHSLPSEPNIRRDLTANLAHAAEELGMSVEARRYRLESISAHNQHLWAGFLHESDWDRMHFTGMKRFSALGRVIASRLNGVLWGHGERWIVLAINLCVLALLVFPILILRLSPGTTLVGGGGMTYANAVWLSVSTMIPAGELVEITTTDGVGRALLTVEAFAGLVISGLFVTLVFRAIVRR